MRKCLPWKKNECVRNENKNQQAIIEMLIENSNKKTGTGKTVEKKTSTLNSKINSTNYETIALKNRLMLLQPVKMNLLK